MQVTGREANFVTVRVKKGAAEGVAGRTDLLCSVRALLKKIKQTVLVGDNVEVDGVDWVYKQGRDSSAILEPAR